MAPRKLTLDDYLITEDGEIINKITGKKLTPQPNSKGYLRVQIGGKRYFVHRLVAEKYIPNPDNKEQVNHIDGDKTNNKASNLEWTTNQENRNHAVKNHLHLCGEDCPWAKLNWEKVNFIRSHPEYTNKDLASMFNVSPGTISNVRNNRRWKVENLC